MNVGERNLQHFLHSIFLVSRKKDSMNIVESFAIDEREEREKFSVWTW